MGMSALVLGNGESRSSLNLNSFTHDIIIGCNAVHRDIAVDYLVCADKRTVKEAVENKIKNIYTRKEWAEQFKVNTVPELPYQGSDRVDNPKHWGSGPYAVLLAAQMADNIKLLGFDLYGISTYRNKNSLTVRELSIPQVNNIYKDTKNYATSDSHAVDFSYWVYQLGKIFELFPNIEFTILNKLGWKMPEAWLYQNVKFEAIPVDL
jgi:hypothetical protein